MAKSIMIRAAQRRTKGGILMALKDAKQNNQNHFSSHTTLRKDIKIAVVGSGPAGFYASQHLINHGGDKITVDIFERLPIPFGLKTRELNFLEM